MRGIPKTIATAHDLEVFRELYPAECERYCKELEENRFVWEQGDTVLAKDVSKVVQTEDLKVIQSEVDGVVTYHKAVRKEDPTSAFCRLGLKAAVEAMPVEEVEEVVK